MKKSRLSFCHCALQLLHFNLYKRTTRKYMIKAEPRHNAVKVLQLQSSCGMIYFITLIQALILQLWLLVNNYRLDFIVKISFLSFSSLYFFSLSINHISFDTTQAHKYTEQYIHECCQWYFTESSFFMLFLLTLFFTLFFLLLPPLLLYFIHNTNTAQYSTPLTLS